LRVSTESADFSVELEKGQTQGTRDLVEGLGEGGPAGTEDAQVDLGLEEGGAKAVAGDRVAVGGGNAVDEALEAEAAQVCWTSTTFTHGRQLHLPIGLVGSCHSGCVWGCLWGSGQGSSV
jgi:hypothetical protein